MEEIILEVWGDFACFSDPAGGKVERLSYPFPTPSAVRGILSAIYSKPPEFFWQINRIEVLNPIRYISFKRNEIKSTVRDKPIYTDEDRTQRQTVALRPLSSPGRPFPVQRSSSAVRPCGGFGTARRIFSRVWVCGSL